MEIKTLIIILLILIIIYVFRSLNQNKKKYFRKGFLEDRIIKDVDFLIKNNLIDEASSWQVFLIWKNSIDTLFNAERFVVFQLLDKYKNPTKKYLYISFSILQSPIFQSKLATNDLVSLYIDDETYLSYFVGLPIKNRDKKVLNYWIIKKGGN